MKEHDFGTVRKLAWTEICPWLCLFQTFRLAVGPRLLVLSAAALFAIATGWSILEVILPVGEPTSEAERCPWLAITALVPDRPSLSPGMGTLSSEPSRENVPETTRPSTLMWLRLATPFRPGAQSEGVIGGLRTVLGFLWMLVVWAFLGGAITRTAAVQLAAEERIGLSAMLDFARAKWGSYVAAPLFPLGGVLLAVVPIAVLGLIMRLDFGVLVAAVFWPLALLGGLVMAILLLGLLFGWPLMWATISTEGTDSFDALSRSYAYVFQRPLHYLFYAVVALGFGALGWLLVSNFAAAVIQLTYWAAGWGCGREQLGNVLTGSEALGMMGGAGATLIRFWVGCVKLLAAGFIYSYFWTASVAIYLLLRRDVDATEMDEVFQEEETEEPAYGLPTVSTDETGAPTIEESTTASNSTNLNHEE